MFICVVSVWARYGWFSSNIQAPILLETKEAENAYIIKIYRDLHPWIIFLVSSHVGGMDVRIRVHIHSYRSQPSLTWLSAFNDWLTHPLFMMVFLFVVAIFEPVSCGQLFMNTSCNNQCSHLLAIIKSCSSLQHNLLIEIRIVIWEQKIADLVESRRNELDASSLNHCHATGMCDHWWQWPISEQDIFFFPVYRKLSFLVDRLSSIKTFADSSIHDRHCFDSLSWESNLPWSVKCAMKTPISTSVQNVFSNSESVMIFTNCMPTKATHHEPVVAFVEWGIWIIAKSTFSLQLFFGLLQVA